MDTVQNGLRDFAMKVLPTQIASLLNGKLIARCSAGSNSAVMELPNTFM